MKTNSPKKETKKKAPAKKVVKKEPEVVAPTYKITASFNDQTLVVETDNLKEALMDMKPHHLKTKVVFKIEKDDKVCERVLFVFDANKMWRNNVALGIFIRRLVFK